MLFEAWRASPRQIGRQGLLSFRNLGNRGGLAATGSQKQHAASRAQYPKPVAADELEHAGSKETITVMELPAVNTPQFDWARTHMPRQPRPVARVVRPQMIADAVYRAASKPRR